MIVINPKQSIVAREKNLEEQDKDYEPITDAEYKDAETFDATFGDKYNENFLKDLAKIKNVQFFSRKVC